MPIAGTATDFRLIAKSIPPRRPRGRPPEASRDVPPTPETAAKLKPNFLLALPTELQQAAIAIDRAFCAICVRSQCRASNPEPKTGRSNGTDMGKRMSDLVDQYGVWCAEMRQRHLPLEHIIAMVVDGMAPTEVDWRTHHPQGWGTERLIEALELYRGLR